MAADDEDVDDVAVAAADDLDDDSTRCGLDAAATTGIDGDWVAVVVAVAVAATLEGALVVVAASIVVLARWLDPLYSLLLTFPLRFLYSDRFVCYCLLKRTLSSAPMVLVCELAAAAVVGMWTTVIGLRALPLSHSTCLRSVSRALGVALRSPPA